MKIRIYSPFFPYPFTEAAYLVIFNQAVSLLKLKHEVEIVIWKDNPEYIEKILAENENEIPKNLKIICLTQNKVEIIKNNSNQFRSQKSNLSRTETRISRFIRVIKCLFTDRATPEEYYYPRIFDQREKLPLVDLAIYHYSFCYNWFKKKKNTNESKKIVFYHNLESQLFSLRAKTTKNPIKKFIHEVNKNRLLKHEVFLQRFANEVWFITNSDLKDLKDKGFDLEMKVINPTVDKHWAQSKRNLKETSSLKLGFIGSQHFYPNQLGVEWILKELAPLLEKNKFTGEVVIVGKKNIDLLSQFDHISPFVKLLDFIVDVETFWSDLSFLLVPDFSGIGVRIKTIESLARGVPVITNSFGFDRLSPNIKACPYLFNLNSPQDWCDFILKEKPQIKRQVFHSQPLLSAIDGEEIYKFIK